jgi:leader peptidase (prepilin peptidase)/N-methyltransferase
VWLILNFGFILIGLIIGSFLNVCIYRIPRHKSIINPSRSFCPNCLKPIKAFDNIPVLSYILLGGKCRNCKTRISWQYPFVELLTGILFLLLFLKFGLSVAFLRNIIFFALLIIATFTDFSHRVIPNVISIPGIILGLVLNLGAELNSASPNFKNAVLGALIGAGILWVFRQAGLIVKKQEMMGWGDIKLAGMIGAFLGIANGVLALFLGVFLGVVIWTILILLKIKNRKEYIPFGAFLALGSVITVFFGSNIINWYLKLFNL